MENKDNPQMPKSEPKTSTKGLSKISEIIRHTRGDLSYKAFAKQCGLAKSTVERLEKQMHVPTAKTIELIAPLTQYTFEELLRILGGDDLSAPHREILVGETLLEHLHALPDNEKELIIESLIGGMSPEERRDLLSKLIKIT